MSLDQPASSQALWEIYDASGIRPEWLLPVLAFESGFNPAVQNGQGAPYYGIGQNYGPFITQHTGVSVDEYLTWSASQQLRAVVLPYFVGVQQSNGPIRSGIQVYQAELAPASLKYAPGLDDAIYSEPSGGCPPNPVSDPYCANRVFDKDHKGYISPRDLGAAVQAEAAKQSVQTAIDAAYAERPDETQTDPVYGLGGSPASASNTEKLLLAASTATVIAAAWWGWKELAPRRRRAPASRRRRAYA